MTSKLLAYINIANSVIVGLTSYFEFKDALHPGPEVNLTMFLVLLSLTFSNNIRAGNKALINAALICSLIAFVLQLMFAHVAFNSQFEVDRWRKMIIIGMLSITLISHVIYKYQDFKRRKPKK